MSRVFLSECKTSEYNNLRKPIVVKICPFVESMLTCTLLIFSLLFSQGSDEHVSEDTSAAAITDEKRQKVAGLITAMPKILPFEFFMEITHGFSKELEIGRGGFGVVYKVRQHPCVSCLLLRIIYICAIWEVRCESKPSGNISSLQQGFLLDGQAIAVRRLLRFQGIQMNHFTNEVNILMKLRHKNIVNLLGYCNEVRLTPVQHQGKYVMAETSEQLLCYEYLEYGSIDRFIFGMITKSDVISP